MNAIRNHVIPVIGHMRLAEVRPDDAKLVMNALAGTSASLQSKVLSKMRMMFDNAVDNGLIDRNPCGKLKNGGYKAKEKEALSEAQVKTLLEAVQGTRAETFVKVGLYTGMRREEILGLKWDCVHLDGETPYIKVKRALRWERCRPVVSELLKSEASRRTIPIPNQLVAHLRSIQQAGNADKYVIGGDPLSQAQFNNLWHKVKRCQTGEKTYTVNSKNRKERVSFYRELVAKSSGGNFYYTIDFQVTPHILRHTYITRMILSGANLKRVQYLAGHASIKITLEIYTHLIENSPEKMMEEVSNAFAVKNEVK